MAQKRFNALNWYKKITNNKRMNKRNSKSLQGFLLIWSAFENLYFDEERLRVENRLFQLGNSANNIINPLDYKRFIHHFHERYFGLNPEGEQLFNNLFIGNEYRDMVSATVRDGLSTDKILPSLLLIANRYRNNFIHGRKEPIKLHEFEKQFNILNLFLAKFIEQTTTLRRDN